MADLMSWNIPSNHIRILEILPPWTAFDLWQHSTQQFKPADIWKAEKQLSAVAQR